MQITRDRIRTLVTTPDFQRAQNMFNGGQVTDLTSQNDTAGRTIYSGRVQDETGTHNVRARIKNDRYEAFCDCTGWGWIDERYYFCPHVAALLLGFIDTGDTSASDLMVSRRSDDFARQILNRFLGNTQAVGETGVARLVPRIQFSSRAGDYPEFVLTIGIDKMYIIKNIEEFAGNVMERRTATYGKNLTLFHGIEMFDKQSQALIDIVLDQFRQFRSMNPVYSYNAYNVAEPSNRGTLSLQGDAFDQWFNVLKNQALLVRGTKDKMISFNVGNPEVSLSLKKAEKHVDLQINVKGDLTFFGSRKTLYAVTENEILRCSREFRSKVYPFLNSSSRSMRIGTSDMMPFSNLVLQQVRDIIPIDDPDGLMDSYLPDECVARFYFDLEDEVLKLRIAFRYGEEEVKPGTRPADTPKVKRDTATEQDIIRFASHYLTPTSQDYILEGDETIYEFLGDGMEKFQEKGEVMVTDRLRNLQVHPTRASVGISVSDGSLFLSIDTGEFPASELEELYESLLQKKRYYKLKDGRILKLDGSSIETMAEMSHMMRLSPKELEQGKVKVPAFRALYLDGLLSNNENFRVTRDKQFRTMIRNFKSVSESDYTVPGQLDEQMRPYQKIGFQWMKTLENCNFGGILADEMGLGKTVEAIAYLSTVPFTQVGRPSLIICPASLILNWMDEIARFAPQLKAVAIMGQPSERKQLMESSGEMDIWVTSYELLRQDVKKYEPLKFYCCILDEGQHVKNQTTQASKAVKQVDCQQRFILTGTPIENRLSELWNLFDFLMPGYLFTHSVFLNKLEKPAVRSKDPEAMEQLRRLVQPFMLRRLKKDVLKELPPIIEHVRRIPVSEAGRKVYLATAQRARASLDSSEDSSKLKILAALTRLRQICCDPSLVYENYEGPADKLDACMDLCAGMVENGHQILLFSQFTTMLDKIRARLNEMQISSYTLQGSTTKEMRARLVRMFNDGGASVFLISLKAGGTGLNLTAADVVIHYDPWWNIAAQDQATGRAHRIGQQQHVQVYKLIAQDTIEEKIMELQEKKASLMDALSDGSDASILNMSKDDLLALLDT